MSVLTPLRVPNTGTPNAAAQATNAAETVRQEAQTPPPGIRAQDDDDEDKDDEDDEEDEDDDKSKKSKSKAKKKKTKAIADDSDVDEADRNDPAASASRARERSRIRAILESDAGKARPSAAMQLALNTRMARGEAVAVLSGFPVESKQTGMLAQRMAAEPTHEVGPEVPNIGRGDDPQAHSKLGNGEVTIHNPALLAQAIVNAGRKRRGEV
jgi:hypothetical protein